MTKQKTLLTLAIVAMLTGCSSSSSNDSVANNTGSNNTGSNNTGSNNTGSNNTGSNNTGSNNTGSNNTGSNVESGNVLSEDNNNRAYFSYADDKDSDLNTITIEGKHITLVPAGISAGGFVTLNDRIVSGTKYKHSKFGVVDNNDNFGVFAHGFATATDTMPVKGTATYKGGAVGAVKDMGAFTTGNSLAKVDFAKKSVAVTLDQWKDSKVKTMNATGTISGNTFKGVNGDTELRGQFYGNGAAELGGVLKTKQDGRDAGASFGAIKQ